MALPTISEINAAAVRAAARDLAVRRGMDRVMTLHGGPVRAPATPKAVGRPDTATSTTSARRDAVRLGRQQAVIDGRAGRRASPARRDGTHAMSADDHQLIGDAACMNPLTWGVSCQGV